MFRSVRDRDSGTVRLRDPLQDCAPYTGAVTVYFLEVSSDPVREEQRSAEADRRIGANLQDDPRRELEQGTCSSTTSVPHALNKVSTRGPQT